MANKRFNAYEEISNFRLNPIGWVESWNDANGRVLIEKADDVAEGGRYLSQGEGRYTVALYVEQNETPLGTGIAKSVAEAFECAIKAVEAMQPYLEGANHV